MVRSLIETAWEKKWSVFGIMRKSGSLIGRKMIKSYVKRRMAETFSEQEEKDMMDYFHQIFMREGSTEYAIYVCFHLGMYAVLPLESPEKLGNPELPLAISFFYGDRDWMDEQAGARVIAANRFKSNDPLCPSQLYIISDSDHHLYLDNPAEFAKSIIEDINLFLLFE